MSLVVFLFITLFSITACSDYASIIVDEQENFLTECKSSAIEKMSSGKTVEMSSSVFEMSSGSQARSSCSAATELINLSSGVLVDARDNQSYKTISIGSQIWMAENLNFAYDGETAKSFCYKNSEDFCKRYGRLYLWSAAMDSVAAFANQGAGCGNGRFCGATGFVQGVCPSGWHIPQTDEWERMLRFVGGIDSAGLMLKSKNGWMNGGDGLDSILFSALPGGHRVVDGHFYNEGISASFWTSNENSGGRAFYVGVFADSAKIVMDSYSKAYGRSVRCVKDSSDDLPFIQISSSSNNQKSSSSGMVSSSSEKVTSSSSMKFPESRNLAVFAFTFDDGTYDDYSVDDKQVVEIFDERNAKCGFALIGHTVGSNVKKRNAYLMYMKNGHSVLNHGQLSTQLTDYSSAKEVEHNVRTAYNNLKKAGFVFNGFICPGNKWDVSFRSVLGKYHDYSFGNHGNGEGIDLYDVNTKQQDVLCLRRRNIEKIELDKAKELVDIACEKGLFVTFYAHSRNLDGMNGRNDLNFLSDLLDYVIKKCDGGECFFGSPDAAVKYYYDL